MICEYCKLSHIVDVYLCTCSGDQSGAAWRERYDLIKAGAQRRNDRHTKLRKDIECIATDLQSLGHETPWDYGKQLRNLLAEDGV